MDSRRTQRSTLGPTRSPYISGPQPLYRSSAMPVIPQSDSHHRSSLERDNSPKDFDTILKTERSAKPPSIKISIGGFGIVIILGGTILCLGVMAFLIFLWVGKGSDGGDGASWVWRSIVLGEMLTLTITLSSAVLRVALAGQAAVGTSLMAALLLEKHGVPLANVAEVSVMRSVNDGPRRLAWLLISSKDFRHSAKFPAILIAFLLIGALASQFTSSILISDLSQSILVGNRRNSSVLSDVAPSTIGVLQTSAGLTGQPSISAFGEWTGLANTTSPTSLGVSDTGIVRRIFMPLPEINQTTLRSYEGKAYMYSSRYVCIRPSGLSAAVQVDPASTVNARLGQVPRLIGNISFVSTFSDAGLDFPPGCDSGTCFSESFSFNCTLPHFDFGGTAPPGFDFDSFSACMPGRANTLRAAPMYGMSGFPIANFSQVTFVITSNLTGTQVTDVLPKQGVVTLPGDPRNNEESVTWEVDGISLTMSLCLQQLTYDFVDVRMSSERDLSQPGIKWSPDNQTWTTGELTSMFASGFSAPNASTRGIYTVQNVSNVLQTNLTSLMTQLSQFANVGPLSNRNINLFLSQLASGASTIVPDITYRALFADTMKQTGRPGLALQSIMTVLAGATVAGYVPQLDRAHVAAVVPSVSVLAPRRVRGIIAVGAVMFVTLACTWVIAGLFVRRTRHSMQGNHWHAVAQVVSEETRWILDEAVGFDDESVYELVRKKRGSVNVRVVGPDDIERRVRLVVTESRGL